MRRPTTVLAGTVNREEVGAGREAGFIDRTKMKVLQLVTVSQTLTHV
jgi:hypothetical protein